MPDAFYSDKLYPFMDRILASIRQANTNFYLTGGTALGRHYLHHRYSDDLDLFVNDAGDFRDQVKRALEAVRRNGVAFDVGTAADTFLRILAHEEEMSLKIDFVNDVAFRYGDLQEAPFYPRIDHWRNILSNKLCTLSRREPKDMADILVIAQHFPFSWPEVFSEARQKDLWVEPIELSKIIQEFPLELLEAVKWEQSFDPGIFTTAREAIQRDIFHGLDNSLPSRTPAKR